MNEPEIEPFSQELLPQELLPQELLPQEPFFEETEPAEPYAPLGRPRGVAPEPPAEAVAAAEEAEGATTAPAAEKGWEGVISRAFIAFSPMALFR